MTESTPSTPAALTDVGSVLKQARMRRGQTLDTVFQHTRIPKKFLDALESNRFEELPGKVYLHGFLKNYCDHLDIDFTPLWEQISPSKPKVESKEESPAQAPEPQTVEPALAPKLSKPMEGPRPQAAIAAKGSNRRSIFTKPKFEAYTENIFQILAAVVLAALIGVAFWKFRADKPFSAVPVAAQKLPAPIAPIQVSDKMTLKITFRREAWMRLRCDGRLRFEGRGPAGLVQGWPATGEFLLRVPDPEALSLNLNGSEMPLTPAMKTPSGDYRITRP